MIPLLQTIAPTLFKLIATKFGSIVTEKIKEKLEVSELPDKLSASDIAKLQELDKELALEFYRLDIDDRKSARKNNNKDSTPKVLAYLNTIFIQLYTRRGRNNHEHNDWVIGHSLGINHKLLLWQLFR